MYSPALHVYVVQPQKWASIATRISVRCHTELVNRPVSEELPIAYNLKSAFNAPLDFSRYHSVRLDVYRISCWCILDVYLLL